MWSLGITWEMKVEGECVSKEGSIRWGNGEKEGII